MSFSRKFILVTMSALGLVACSQPEPTIEEKILINSFASLTAAQTYDQFCEDGKITKAPPTRDLNIYWYGNQQMLAAMIAAPMKRRYPKDTIERSVKRLTTIQDKAAVHYQKILDEKGCESPEALGMKKSLQMFTAIHPGALSNVISQKIKQEGGTITILTDEENKVPQEPAQP